MEVNNISFGSTFKLNAKQVKKIKKRAANGITQSILRYSGIPKSQLQDWFSGETSTITIQDSVDNMLLGFLKTINVIPEKVSQKLN